MMEPVYIHSAVAISPQDSFEPESFLKTIYESDSNKIYIREPDYRNFINPVAIRRMSRLIKMGISCGMSALQNAAITQPDAIITGTGLGSMTDTEKFLKDMIHFKEEALNPTDFIQSTYNSINGWLSLQTKATGYNQTYVHRGLSMEMALLDAQVFLQETDEKKYVLAGGFDEMTEEYYIVKNKVGYWKEKHIPNLALFKHKALAGTIGGEGTAFFVLSNKKENAVADLLALKPIPEISTKTLQSTIKALLESHNLKYQNIDVIITGRNGDASYEPLYQHLENSFPQACITGFKHLTGEYPTASGFALWLAVQLITRQTIPKAIYLRKRKSSEIRYVLIVNHYLLGSGAVMLLQKPL